MFPTPGDAALVEQERLDRRAPAARHRPQRRAGELVGERLEAEAGGEERVARGGAERDLARPEAPRVAEADLVRAGVEDEADADVGRVRRRVEQQHARHAQVHEQERVVLELPHEVLAAPREPLDAPPLERVADRAGLERQAPAGVEDVERRQLAPLDDGRELAADRLDLGELGHRSQYAVRLMPAATGVSTGVAASAMSSCRTCAVSSAPSIQ